MDVDVGWVGSTVRCGIIMVKVEPCPTKLFTLIFPLCTSTIQRQMAKPKPAPLSTPAR